MDGIACPVQQVEMRSLALLHRDGVESSPERQKQQFVRAGRPSKFILRIGRLEKQLKRRIVVAAHPAVDELEIVDLTLIVRNHHLLRRKKRRSRGTPPHNLPERKSCIRAEVFA